MSIDTTCFNIPYKYPYEIEYCSNIPNITYTFCSNFSIPLSNLCSDYCQNSLDQEQDQTYFLYRCKYRCKL